MGTKQNVLLFAFIFPVFFSWMTNDWQAIFYLTPTFIDNWHFRTFVENTGKTNDLENPPPEMELSFLGPSLTDKTPAEIVETSVYGYPTLLKGYSNPAPFERLMTLMKNATLIDDVDVASVSDSDLDHLSSNCKKEWSHKQMSLYEMIDIMENEDRSVYTGFQSPFENEEMNEMLGFNDMSEYVYIPRFYAYSFFFAKLAHAQMTAGIHCAPVESAAFQVMGKKTWLFWEPHHFAKNVPHMTFQGWFTKEQTDDELQAKLGRAFVMETEPGDYLYFGSGWCHAVLSEEGYGLLFTIRYFPDRFKFTKLPWSFLFQFFARRWFRGLMNRSRDCHEVYGTMCKYFTDGGNMDCGKSTSFYKTVDLLKARMADPSKYGKSGA